MPCGGTGKKQFFFGGPFQHSLTPVVIDKFINIATVPNPAGGDPIPPYERWSPDEEGDTGCEVHNCRTDPGQSPCDPWIGVNPDQYSFANPGPNVFQKERRYFI